MLIQSVSCLYSLSSEVYLLREVAKVGDVGCLSA